MLELLTQPPPAAALGRMAAVGLRVLPTMLGVQ